MGKIICFDFDGVLHSYESGWQGAHVIPDPPVPGAIQFLKDVVASEEYEAHIFSSRSHQSGGIGAIISWLLQNGIEKAELEKIRFPSVKPPAFVTIDDRAIQFDGNFVGLWKQIANFKPWNKRGI